MVLLLSHQQTKLWCFSIYIANDYNVKTIYYLHNLSPSQWMHQIHCCTMYSATNSIYWVVKKAASAMLDKNVNFISAKNSITASNTFTHLLNLREKEMSFLSVFFLSFRATARKLKHPILSECTKYEPKHSTLKICKNWLFSLRLMLLFSDLYIRFGFWFVWFEPFNHLPEWNWLIGLDVHALLE